MRRLVHRDSAERTEPSLCLGGLRPNGARIPAILGIGALSDRSSNPKIRSRLDIGIRSGRNCLALLVVAQQFVSLFLKDLFVPKNFNFRENSSMFDKKRKNYRCHPFISFKIL